jgi:hypothetical protein
MCQRAQPIAPTFGGHKSPDPSATLTCRISTVKWMQDISTANGGAIPSPAPRSKRDHRLWAPWGIDVQTTASLTASSLRARSATGRHCRCAFAVPDETFERGSTGRDVTCGSQPGTGTLVSGSCGDDVPRMWGAASHRLAMSYFLDPDVTWLRSGRYFKYRHPISTGVLGSSGGIRSVSRADNRVPDPRPRPVRVRGLSRRLGNSRRCGTAVSS